MKIDSVVLEDFQSHEKSTIDFCHGFNVVIGKTNHGKSAIFRALRHAFFDSWNKRYVRTGKKNYKIEVIFDSGDRLIRIRGDKNEVKFISAAGVETQFESFGDTLPQKMKDLLKIPDFKIDSDKEIIVNVASQQDPLFLISPQAFSAPLVSKFFSRLSGIHILDSANRNIDKDKKNKMEEVKNLDESINKNAAALKSLEKIFDWKEIIESKIKEAAEIENKVKSVEDFSALLNRIKSFNEKRKKLDALEAELNKVDLSSIDNFISKSDNLMKHIELYDKAIKVKTQLSNLNSKLEDQQRRLEAIELERKEFMSTLKMCPFCGSKIESAELSCH